MGIINMEVMAYALIANASMCALERI